MNLELERTRRLAGLAEGEAFEVAYDANRGARFRELEPARAWLEEREREGRDFYVCLNPIRADSKPPKGRARDEDVALVRTLLVDCDPKKGNVSAEAIAAAAAIADQVLVILTTRLRARPARIFSGRGRQLWLRHEPLAPGDARLAVRKRLLEVLAARLEHELAKVDVAVHNPARLARLPGTVNTKTGQTAAIEDEGDGAEVSIADLERLVQDLAAEHEELLARRREEEKRERPRRGSDWPEAYVRAALRRILGELRSAEPGDRNNTLNRSAFALGQLEAGGAPVAHAREELRDAAIAAGLPEREAEKTIASGWSAGREQPRKPPGGSASNDPTRVARDDEEERDDRIAIPVTDNIAAMTDAAQTVLVGAGEPIWVSSWALARIARSSEGARIEKLPLAALKKRLSARARFERPGKGSSVVAVPPPEDVVRALASEGTWEFPELLEIVDAPALLPDGRVIDRPGYDPVSRIYYEPSATFPPVPEAPTRQSAREALGAIGEVFCDFPFVFPSDRSGAIALVLTLVGRTAIADSKPLFMIRASNPGTGKGLLAKVASLVATGREPTVIEAVVEDAEWRKQITTSVKSGAAFCLIDEAEKLASKALASALTLEWWTDRELKSNDQIRGRCPIFASAGNNTTVAGDLERRVVPIDLDAGVERPEERTGFRRRPLDAWVRRERPRLLVAALTVLRAYVVAGRPRQELSEYGSFDFWNYLVRAALVWAGEADPCEGRARARIREESDTGLEELSVLLYEWRRAVGETPHTVAEILSVSEHEPDLRRALLPFDVKTNGEKLDARRVGYSFRRAKGRIANGLRLEHAGAKHGHVGRWRVVAISPISPVSPGSPPQHLPVGQTYMTTGGDGEIKS